MIQIFGPPQFTFEEETTGIYVFEDDQLDVYKVAEVDNTTYTRGPNQSDQFYAKYLHMHHERRPKPRPTPEEFWASTEPKWFKVWCTPHAQTSKFWKWFSLQVQNLDPNFDMFKQSLEKYGDRFPMTLEYEKDYSHLVLRG